MTNLARQPRLAFRLAFALLFMLAGCGLPVRQPPSAQATPQAANTSTSNRAASSSSATALDHLPLYFVANHGQTDSRVAFYVPGKDNTIYFSPDGLTFAFNSAPSPAVTQPGLGTPRAGGAVLKPMDQNPAPQVGQRWAVKLDFVGANPAVQPLGEDQTAAVFSYFKGQPSQWQTGLPSYAQIRYANLWPGIDLVYSGQGNQMKYEFAVQPGADPAQIKLAYRGASAVQLTANGQLEVTTPVGGFQDATPVAYQMKDGQRVPVEMGYSLTPPVTTGEAARYAYSFRVGAYDATLPLVLDPAVLVYAGYIGGMGNEEGAGIAVDGAGNAYVTGYTESSETSFPVKVGPYLTFRGGIEDAFVAKVNATGSALVYAGYIGGADNDQGTGIAVDKDGNAYVTGLTRSSEATFPVMVGPDLTYNGGADAFVAKVNSAGTALVYAGYLGGAGDDAATGIAVDGAENAYVSGYTSSNQTTFPVKIGPDLTYNGGVYDAFAAKVNAAGTALAYAGYIGGSGTDYGYGIAADSAGNAYITGNTVSDQSSFPVKGGPDLTYNGGTFGDGFVAKVNAAGTGLAYAGYIGGAGNDYGYGIAADNAGNAYVTGYTSSDQTSFPVMVGPDLTFNSGGYDAFVAKVNSAGTALVYAGYVGGAGEDFGYGVAVDGSGNAYITGKTYSDQASFPVTSGPDLTYNGSGDAFVAKLNATGTAFGYAGYIGGVGFDYANAIAVDGHGNAYVTGFTASPQTTFPVTVGPDLTANGGQNDAFVAKISPFVPFTPTAFLFLPLVRM